MTYLKPNDEKSVRDIKPLEVGDFRTEGRLFAGEGLLFYRGEQRTFRHRSHIRK